MTIKIKTPAEKIAQMKKDIAEEADYLRKRIEEGLAGIIDDLPESGGTVHINNVSLYNPQKQFCFDLLKKSGWRTVEWKIEQVGSLFWKKKRIKLVVEPL